MKIKTKTRVITKTQGIVEAGEVIEEDVTAEWVKERSHLYELVEEQPEQEQEKTQDYSEYTNKELRKICRENDLPVYGNKKKLVKRIEEEL